MAMNQGYRYAIGSAVVGVVLVVLGLLMIRSASSSSGAGGGALVLVSALAPFGMAWVCFYYGSGRGSAD